MLAEVLQEGSPVMRLAGSFRATGHEIYLVGGPVRRGLLGKASQDLDFALRGASPDAGSPEAARLGRCGSRAPVRNRIVRKRSI
jgi:tRNA nucleotidyltransferase/poly(A) polymerase